MSVVKIEKLDDFGRGIAFLNNKIVFISNALVDEVVDIEITNTNKKYDEAIVKEYIKTSSSRREAKCIYYGVCGGCHIMHMKYNDQLDFKSNKVKSLFKRMLNLENVVKSIDYDNEFNYRNKITLKIDDKIGYYKQKSHDIVDINECLIADLKINQKIKDLRLEKLSEKKDVVIKSNELLSDGKLLYKLGNKDFLLSDETFFQINNEVALKLYDKIKSYINNDRVLELYAGAATIGLYIQDKAESVISVEINSQACGDANYNILLNNIKNIKVVNDDAFNYLKTFNENIDTIIVDPPRSGLLKGSIPLINDIAPSKIIYVSCDPTTLVRDIKELNDYQVKEVYLYDMFPNTYHVECLVLMNRIK